MMKKLYSLFLILTPIEKVHAFQQIMSVSITFVKNYDEMAKDFASRNFKVKAKAITLFREVILETPVKDCF